MVACKKGTGESRSPFFMFLSPRPQKDQKNHKMLTINAIFYQQSSKMHNKMYKKCTNDGKIKQNGRK
jgi:hypothetical protein